MGCGASVPQDGDSASHRYHDEGDGDGNRLLVAYDDANHPCLAMAEKPLHATADDAARLDTSTSDEHTEELARLHDHLWETGSRGEARDEPFEFTLIVRRQAQIMRAKYEHGITDDVDQFKVGKPPAKVRRSARATVNSWLISLAMANGGGSDATTTTFSVSMLSTPSYNLPTPVASSSNLLSDAADSQNHQQPALTAAVLHVHQQTIGSAGGSAVDDRSSSRNTADFESSSGDAGDEDLSRMAAIEKKQHAPRSPGVQRRSDETPALAKVAAAMAAHEEGGGVRSPSSPATN